MKEGPKRDPRPILPENTDVTSPYALFSLFWTDEMFEILANNANLYAEQQETHRGWYATNADEMRVFIGILIYMGLHPEGETPAYWHEDLRTGPNHMPSLHMGLNRFSQLQRFVHIAPPGGEPELTADEIEKMTQKQKDQNPDKHWWRKIEAYYEDAQQADSERI
ncbi:hypothetical protein N7G274_001833 [Stereocaulon virgatum]|uniref:PiggyBac transposable element-derived protein domain-containing protein n=1 Tax=Stereocaulon virgatum TaxID=373712 RepID=A0ABR4ANI4_9LECA